MALLPGTRLGPYQILDPLGAGGMGEVYRARDTRLARDVAIKTLSTDSSATPAGLARLEQEARAASALNHPNIVTLYDVGWADGTFYLSMELVDGQTLRHRMASGPLPLRQTLEIAAQIADGLAKAHTTGIVHRDLKPENVMLSKDGVVKILDFGLARILSGWGETLSEAPTAPISVGGAIVGTVAYMSPEQARGAPAEFQSDQFALGILLYEMVTGRRAFQRPSAAQILAAIIEDDPTPGLGSKVPLALRWIIERCLTKEPENRYASTRDLALDLKKVRDHQTELGASSAIPSRAPSVGREALRAMPGLVAGVVLGVVVALWLLRPEAALPPVLRTLTFSGQDFAPAISPDGRTIAFASHRDDKLRIWLRQVAGGREVALTSGPDSEPRFSPDGSTLLFVRHGGAGHPVDLYRVPTVGGDARKILSDVQQADWAPDSRRIVFTRTSYDQGTLGTIIGIVNADGEGEQVIHRAPTRLLTLPRWSPDGSIIATSQDLLGVSEASLRGIFILHSDGSGAHLINTPLSGGPPSAVAWLDEGRTLLYALPESAASVRGLTTSIPSSRVIRQDVQAGKAQVVFWMPTVTRTLEILRGGGLLFDSFTGRENLREFELQGQLPGTFERWNILTRGNNTDRQPCYSPDGRSLVFTSNRSGNLDVWIMSLKDHSIRNFTDHPEDDWDPAFTSDGSGLIWTSRRGGNFEIWIANLDGTRRHQVTHDGKDAENASQARIGGWIIYNSGNPERSGVWKIHPDGTGAQRLVAGTTSWPEVSPDGRFALYTLVGGPSRIRVVRVEDGVDDPFEIRATGGGDARARWLPDGHSIAFTDVDEKGRLGLFVQEFVPGQDTSPTRRPLAGFDLDSKTESFAFSLDGTRVTIASFEQIQTLMMAENVPGIRTDR